MRCLDLILLAGLQLSAARAPSFSYHDDLEAFPQFEVVFATGSVSEKEANALLDENIQHPTYSAEFPHPTGHDAEMKADEDSGASRTPGPKTTQEYQYEILNLSPHKYLCSIPNIEPPGPINETENALAKAEEERELHRAAVKGWELINNFENSCLYYVSGWWSYSFCKNREIVQYHAVSAIGNGQIPRRDPHGQEYILGQVPTLPATTGGDWKQAKQRGRGSDDPFRPPAELQVKGDQRYLVQKLEGGTVCDLTGKERTVEVQYQCAPGLRHDKIGWIKEVITCSYVMMINTPRLCKDVAFQPPAEKAVNPISCQLISDTTDVSQPLLDQDASGANAHAKQGREKKTRKENGEDAKEDQEASETLTIGGVLVGGKRVLPGSDEDGSPVKLQQLLVPQPKVLEVIAQAASRAEGGKIEELSAEELESLNIDPKAVEEMREKLKKLAGESGWKLQLYQMNDEDEKELLGYVDDDADKEDGDGQAKSDDVGEQEGEKEDQEVEKAEGSYSSRPRKGVKDKAENQDAREGSEEKFFNRDEL